MSNSTALKAVSDSKATSPIEIVYPSDLPRAKRGPRRRFIGRRLKDPLLDTSIKPIPLNV